MTVANPSKLIISIILGDLWVYRALGDMLSIIVSNSPVGKRPASIFYPMSPTLYFLIDETFVSRAPG